MSTPAASGTVSIRRSFAFSLVERYLTTVVQFAAAVIVARLLRPEETGIFSVGMSIIGIIHTVRDFGMAQYVVQEKELTERRFRAAVGVTLVISIAFALSLWIGAGAIAAFYREPALVPALRVLAVSLLISPLYAPGAAKLERQMDFATLFKIGCGSAVVGSIVVVTLAFLGASYMALVWGSLSGNVVGLLLLLWYRRRDVLTRPSLAEWRSVVSFGVQATGVSLLSVFGMQAAMLIVPRYLGFAAAGLYGRGHTLVSIFTRDVVGTVYRILVPGFAHTHRTGGDLKGQYLRSVTYLTGVAWPFYAVTALTAELLLVVLFGKAWAGAAPVARVLCLSHAIYTTWSTSTQVIIGLGRIDKILTGEVVQQPLRIGFVFVAAQWGMVEVAWAQAATMAVAAALYFTRLFSLLDISMLDVLRATRPSGVVTIAALLPGAALFYVTSGWDGSPAARLAAVGLVAMLGWLCGIMGTHHPLRAELRRGRHRLARSWNSRGGLG